MATRELRAHITPELAYGAISARTYPVWLDSAGDDRRHNHHSIIAADPVSSFIVDSTRQLWIDDEPCAADWATALDRWLATYSCPAGSDMPFASGAIGYISYDFKNILDALPTSATCDTRLPLICLRQYSWAYVYDHHEGRADLVSDRAVDFDQLAKLFEQATPQKLSDCAFSEHDLQTNMSHDDYLHAIERVRDYIAAGDVYQINFTQRLQTPLRGDIDQLYYHLRRANPAPFAAYLKWDDYAVLSSSPERFIERRGDAIVTRPIKGTAARCADPAADRRRAAALQNSEKDRSELLMIVDLERNDLSKLATRGSVNVPENFAIESYQTVHHLVSTVQATLRPDVTFSDVLKATFPGGSITGAPKIRAMQIIDELEPTARGIYTGSIGYVNNQGDFDFNIVIRTLFVQDDMIYYQVGGGIVWDSQPQLEYEECVAKGIALKRVIYNDQSLK